MRVLLTSIFFWFSLQAIAGQSSITEADGYSCMGVEYSRKETESTALQDAKRNAVEFSRTYIESESQIENFELKKDLVQAFAKADVRVLEILSEEWDDPSTGDCYTIRIQAEVIPPKQDMVRISEAGQFIEDPRAPLSLKIWTNKDEFTEGELMKIYLRGNKPFYGRLIYVDAKGINLQILPNPNRKENYFNGGTVYEVPAGPDTFDLIVSQPFGLEKLVFYASTMPLGQIETSDLGPVLQVEEPAPEVERRTRGITLTKVVSDEKRREVAEFAEAEAKITTKASP